MVVSNITYDYNKSNSGGSVRVIIISFDLPTSKYVNDRPAHAGKERGTAAVTAATTQSEVLSPLGSSSGSRDLGASENPLLQFF